MLGRLRQGYAAGGGHVFMLGWIVEGLEAMTWRLSRGSLAYKETRGRVHVNWINAACQERYREGRRGCGRMCASAFQALNCKCPKREELWVKEDGERGRMIPLKHATGSGLYWMHCVAHVYMLWCAEWLDQGRFSFAALKWSQTLPAFKVDRGRVGLAYCLESFLFCFRKLCKCGCSRIFFLFVFVLFFFVRLQGRCVPPVWSQNKSISKA